MRPAGSEELGTKAELKNMNSFRFLERGIEAEIERQVGILEAGEEVEQETLHFDPRDGALTPLRSKEYAHDYRYFPEPDLVPLAPTEEMLRGGAGGAAGAAGGAARALRSRARAVAETRAAQLAFDAELGGYFEAALDGRATSVEAEGGRQLGHRRARRARCARPETARTPPTRRSTPEALAALVAMVEAKQVTHGGGREVLAMLVAEGGDPAAIVEREDLGAVSDAGELEAIVERAIEAEPEAAERSATGT